MGVVAPRFDPPFIDRPCCASLFHTAGLESIQTGPVYRAAQFARLPRAVPRARISSPPLRPGRHAPGAPQLEWRAMPWESSALHPGSRARLSPHAASRRAVRASHGLSSMGRPRARSRSVCLENSSGRCVSLSGRHSARGMGWGGGCASVGRNAGVCMEAFT